MSIHVKICGITRIEDARDAVEAGADALGFVLWGGSPRRVDAAHAASIGRAIPPGIARVGVFVNAPRLTVESTLAAAALTTAQLHGDERREEFEGTPFDWYRAFRVGAGSEVSSLADSVREMGRPVCLLDTRVEGIPGGTGRAFDWRFAAKVSMNLSLKGGVRIVLAGGLTPDNVAEAIRLVRPWGVDVSSGVESAPGIKDAGRLRAFVAAARSVA